MSLIIMYGPYLVVVGLIQPRRMNPFLLKQPKIQWKSPCRNPKAPFFIATSLLQRRVKKLLFESTVFCTAYCATVRWMNERSYIIQCNTMQMNGATLYNAIQCK